MFSHRSVSHSVHRGGVGICPLISFPGGGGYVQGVGSHPQDMGLGGTYPHGHRGGGYSPPSTTDTHHTYS